MLEEERMQVGKEWMKINLPAEWNDESTIMKWAGICCEERSNKYIFAEVIEKDGEYTFISKYGRIGVFPQLSKKVFLRFTDADKEFTRYIRSKKKQYTTVEFDSEKPIQVPEKETTIDEVVDLADKKYKYDNEVVPKEVEELPKTWKDLSNRFSPFVGKADTVIGEICRALNFAEYRARSQNDWVNFGMTDEEADSSMCTEPIGYFLNVFSDGENDVKSLLESKTKEEWITKLNSIKQQIVNSNVNELSAEKNEEDMSNGIFHDVFMNFWNKNKH